MLKDALVYDCEIIRLIPDRNGHRLSGFDYCDGWRDFARMGISVIGAYDVDEDRYRVFLADNYREFQDLVRTKAWIVGFNSIAFDNPLCAANGIIIPRLRSYDLLVEIWKASGLDDTFRGRSHMGFGLDDCCATNFGLHKSGNGAMAPMQWQNKRHGTVIDYCLQDVALTVKLLRLVSENAGWMRSPKSNEMIKLAPPWGNAPEPPGAIDLPPIDSWKLEAFDAAKQDDGNGAGQAV